MKTCSLVLSILSLVVLCAPAQAPALSAKLESVDKIWDRGKHNAFTDLIRFQNLWYCCFREADAHVGGDGKIRVLASYDSKTWSPVALVEQAGVDLRDPKFCPTKEDRLFMVAGGSVYQGTTLTGRRPRIITSTDGKHWSVPDKALGEGDWLWRAIMHPAEKKYYGVAYNCYPTTGGPKFEKEWTARLYTSEDSKAWSMVAPFDVKGMPNEATVRVLKNGTMMALLRRESQAPDVGFRGMIGSASPPYREWHWKELGVPLGGPNFIELPDGRMVAASRARGKAGAALALFEMKPDSLTPILELPSGGDCSYAGLGYHEGVLYVSYYSSHEGGKACIYLARVQLQ